MRNVTWGFGIGALVVLGAGCKPHLSVDVEVKDDGIVEVLAISDYGVKVECNGKKPKDDLSDRFVFAAIDFKVGKQTIKCTADKSGRTRTVEAAFDRKEIPAEATLAPLDPEHTIVACVGDLCNQEKKLQIDDAGKLYFQVVAKVGVEVEIDGESATVELDEEHAVAARTTMTIDLAKHAPEISLGAFAKDAGAKGGYLKLPAKIIADDTNESSLQIAPVAFRGLIRAVLADVDKGPVTFDGDLPAGKSASSLLFLGDPSLQFFGADTTLRGLDLVAVGVKAKEHSAGSCGSFVGSTGTTTVVKSAIDEDVTVYDRRTGKVKTKRHFTAPYGACPSTIMANGYGDETQTVTSSVDEETIAKWLATLMPKK
jgi:hypothetical protein